MSFITVAGQSVRYVCVGLLVYFLDTSGFVLITSISPGDYLVANIFSKSCAAGAGFLLHKHITFRWQQRDGISRQFTRYLSLLLFNLAASSLLLATTIGVLAWQPLPSKAGAELV